MFPAAIPHRAETLQVLRLIINEPILMLSGDDEGYGSRWTIGGQQVQPAIARYLMESGFVAEIGKTEFGARKLALTTTGNQFREKGLNWWRGLSLLQKMRGTLLGWTPFQASFQYELCWAGKLSTNCFPSLKRADCLNCWPSPLSSSVICRSDQYST